MIQPRPAVPLRNLAEPVNRFSEDDVNRVQVACCFAAAQTGFPHLALSEIIDPPHQWFDAMLARQVALHLAHRLFDIPRRRVVDLTGRGRAGMRLAIITIDDRMNSEMFATAYRSWARHAQVLFDRAMSHDKGEAA
jgi:hypothetical protein